MPAPRTPHPAVSQSSPARRRRTPSVPEAALEPSPSAEPPDEPDADTALVPEAARDNLERPSDGPLEQEAEHAPRSRQRDWPAT